MSSATALVSWHLVEQELAATSDIGSVKLTWRPMTDVAAYEVHAVCGSSATWMPTPATMIAVTAATRFVHRGLGPQAATWSYRVAAVTSYGEHLTTAVTVGRSTTSVTVDGVPLAVVGHFDGSGLDLAISASGFVHYRTTFPHDVDFRYGFDDPERRWSYVQPGPEDAWAGRRRHRFKLRFDLDRLPADDVDVALWLVDRHPTRAGSAALSINGTALESLLFDETTGEGQASLVVPGSGAGPAYFEPVIPRSALVLGENVFEIAKNDGSWIAYDAIGIFLRRTRAVGGTT
ncbi:hypothetical protein [Calidifontibacter terrae]